MIEIQLEVRDSNKVSHFPYYERVPKEEALREMVTSALEPYFETQPELKTKQYFITPSKEWQNLPDHLYLVFEHNEAWGYAIHRIRRKKLLFKTAVMIPIQVTFTLVDSLDQEPLLIKYVYD